jgi:glycerate kinase
MLRIVVAPDSFKGSLTALQAATCIERGFKKVFRGIVVEKVPMADGGGGTAQAIVEATGGRMVSCRARDPRGRPIRSSLGISGDGRTAIIEMAAASGLVLLKPRERNPMLASTSGTGDLIRHALDRGVKKILIGIGGSATTDGGMGMARALGVKFFDREGRELPEGGGSLRRLCRIDRRGLDPRLREVEIEVACDVKNPLFGARGAAWVYGPQKGATPVMVRHLDAGLRQLAKVIRHDLGIDVSSVPGAGAAGGMGAGLVAFLDGRLKSGVGMVLEAVQFRRRLKNCDLVITGEGRLDGQTVCGKTVSGAARLARRHGVPVIAICGCVGAGAEKVLSIGVTAYFSALEEPVDETLLPKRGPAMLTRCVEQVARLLALRLGARV